MIYKFNEKYIAIDLTTGVISRDRLVKNLTACGDPFSDEELKGFLTPQLIPGFKKY